MVHAFSVVPVAPPCSTSIKGIDIEQKFSAMVVCILILHSAIESFTMSVLFGRTRPRLVVREMECCDYFSEMFLELGTIVGEYVLEREREYLSHDVKEFFCSNGRVRGSAQAVAKPRIEVNERDDVSSRAIDVLLEGIKGHTVPRVASAESMRFSVGFESCDGSDATGSGDTLGHHAESPEVFEYPANGLFLGAPKFLCVAELFE